MSGEGYIQAMKKMVSKVSQSGTDLGNAAVNATTLALESLMDLVNNGIDTTPTIRPVIDLSDVESGVTALNGLMTAPRTLSLAGSINRVNSVSNSMNDSSSDSAASNQNGGKTVVQNFTQNNYSPKALSRSEIYRDTKNLFATMKRGGSK